MRRLNRRQRIAAIVLASLAACFITLDLGGSSLQAAHGGVRGALGSLYRGTDSLLGPVRRFVQGLPHAGSDESRIRQLERRNAELKKQLADAQVDRTTAAELTRLRLGASAAGQRVVPARVVATSASGGFDYTVTLDAGTAQGVHAGLTVTDGYGLVGRVLRADSATCVVLLAIDPGSGVGARDRRSGELGVATGAGRDGFSFRPLAPTARLRVGDAVSTGPAGASSFAPGLAVGTVRSVRVSADGTTLADVEPAVAADQLDLVGIIVHDGAGAGSVVAGHR
jgi:rod shape-determining protein MreC